MEQLSDFLEKVFIELHGVNVGLLEHIHIINGVIFSATTVERDSAKTLALRNIDTLPTLTRLEVIKASELIFDFVQQFSELNRQITNYVGSCGCQLDDMRTSILAWKKGNLHMYHDQKIHDSVKFILSCVDELCEGLSSIIKLQSR